MGCSGTGYISSQCEGTPDCHTEANNIPGSTCVDDRCECPSEMDACCPDGDLANCKEKGDYRCRPYDECHPKEPPVMCTTAADCEGPPDLRCGNATCEEGVCVLHVMVPSPPIASQKPGDCATSYCDSAGNVYTSNDPSDVPVDGEACTYDICSGAKPTPMPFPDGTPCPESDSGVCFQGVCVGCLDNGDCKSAKAPKCSSGLTCVPWSCTDGVKNGAETDYDCGGAECDRCDPGQGCASSSDCRSGVCVGNQCKSATHTDGVKNSGETGKDCGCAECTSKCQDGEGCKSANDCLSGVCYGGACLSPTCTDGTQNGEELGPDCGGPCELPCPE